MNAKKSAVDGDENDVEQQANEPGVEPECEAGSEETTVGLKGMEWISDDTRMWYFCDGHTRELSSILKASYGIDHLGQDALWSPSSDPEEEVRRRDEASRRIWRCVRAVAIIKTPKGAVSKRLSAQAMGAKRTKGTAKSSASAGGNKGRSRRASVKDRKQFRASVYDAVGVGGGDDADKSTAVEELASGYLEKKSSGALRKWQTRFFQASGHYLKYFADSRMGEIKAVADLNELETIDHQAGERSFDLEFAHSAFHLRAPTQAEAHKWVAARCLTPTSGH